MSKILNYEPKLLWKFFKEISDIPRESEKEEKIREYLIKTADKYNIKYDVDAIGNVYYYSPATKGYENIPSVALQGHMDMVCVKTSESNHNFDTDPLELYVDGDWLRAKDTTLGADNGIALAMMLAVMTDSNISHGPLEGIVTVAEETGLTGAINVDPTKVNSRMMINLDSEDEGIIFIGCAGGIEVDAKKNLTYHTINSNDQVYALDINGLLGGHSGAEIHTQRANAIKMATDILFNINEISPVSLIKMESGTKRNVIPSISRTIFSVDKDIDLEPILNKCKKTFTDLYEVSDPDFNIQLSKTTSNKALNIEDSNEIIDALFVTPHGVDSMSMSLEGVVETSSNLAIVKIDEQNGLDFIVSCRSSIEGARDGIAKRIKTLWQNISNVEITIHGEYPSWKPDLSLSLYKFCAKAYEDYTKVKPTVTAIHAGLECGIINSRIENMDSVSFGPDIRGAHSVEERLSIKSTQKIYGFLLHLLTIIK